MSKSSNEEGCGAAPGVVVKAETTISKKLKFCCALADAAD